ncbi:MAG: site-specific DNA-methyltransferase [Promethearchaeota archaeon]
MTNLKQKQIYSFLPNEIPKNNWKNMLIWGDNKIVMSSLLEKFVGKVDLVYIDPPFTTGSDFKIDVEIGNKTIPLKKQHSVIEEKVYRDTWGMGTESFLNMIFDRLKLMRSLLSKNGTLYVHCDHRMNSYLRLMLDEIFGKENFLNEIIWQRSTTVGSSKAIAKKYPILNDYILVYVKNSKEFTFNKEYTPATEKYKKRFNQKDDYGKFYWNTLKNFSEKTYKKLESKNQVRWTKSAKYPQYKTYLHELKGNVVSNVWSDINMINPMANERVTYATQKPIALLERIIKTSSNEGDLVADFFCGSGTTLLAAEKLNRQWIGCDLGRFAIHVTRKRLMGIENCKPFKILNLGKYERQMWQKDNFNHQNSENIYLEYYKFILKLYNAELISSFSYIQGRKNGALIHIGAVDTPVTISEIRDALTEVKSSGSKELHILGWEWEMGINDLIEQLAKEEGIKLILKTIPNEAMEQNLMDKKDVRFFDFAYLECEVIQNERKIQIKLTDFVIPNTELVPLEIRSKISNWDEFIDYWAIDFNFKNDSFMNQWTSYRTKQNRSLDLISKPHTFKKAGTYFVFIKVIDIFGIDTSKVITINID